MSECGVWLNVSKTLEKSKDTVTVRHCSGRWLKPLTALCMSGRKAVVEERWGTEALLGVGQWNAAEFREQNALQNFD